MSKRIGDYELEKPLSNKDAGCSKWGYGKKDGKEYFLKEFLTPVCPEDNGILNKNTIEKKMKMCKEFEEKESFLIRKINNASDGNVLRIHEFFRYGTKYYISTEKVDSLDDTIIKKMNFNEKIRILKVLSHSLWSLHKSGIVHGDIKLSNILFMKTKSGTITAKIIDIDGCFFENDIPEPDYIVCDPVYMAPESFNYIVTESGKIDSKIDVFAMGIVFHQILTGKLPIFDTEKYQYVYECVLDGGNLTVNFALKNIFELIQNMLIKNPEDRIDMEQVFSSLTNELQVNRSVQKDNNEKVSISEQKINKEPEKNYESKNDKVDGFFMKAGDL